MGVFLSFLSKLSIGSVVSFFLSREVLKWRRRELGIFFSQDEDDQEKGKAPSKEERIVVVQMRLSRKRKFVLGKLKRHVPGGKKELASRYLHPEVVEVFLLSFSFFLLFSEEDSSRSAISSL